MSTTAPDFRRPPGPDAAVALGLDHATLVTLQRLQREYGDIVSMTQPGGRLAYFINDPAAVRRILLRRHSRYVKGPGFERVKMLLGNGLIVSDGDVWRRSRTMIQPAFKVQNIHRLLQLMVQCSERCAATWAQEAENNADINITEETSEFALELILRSIFGTDYDDKVMASGENPFVFLSRDSTRDLSVVLKVRDLRNMLLGIVDGRRDRAADEFDFLSMYMQATDKSGEHFSDKELLDELMMLIVAGFETSAGTLNWAWYLIAGHPDVEARLLAEAREFLPDAASLNAENIAAMTYTQRVLEEVLRLYPPGWLFTRRATEDDELDDYDVPPGTDIYLSPYILHRTEHYWPNPDEFDPDRFKAGDKPQRDRPYYPFSLGPRRCLGEYFSILEMKVHIGLLLGRFRLERVSDADPRLELAINLRSKNDILLRPSLRQN